MRNKWTKDEIKLLYDNYETMDDKEIKRIIPNHSESSIATKRKRLGLRRSNLKYTYDDVVYMCNQRGYTLLSTKFRSCSDDIEFICNKHQDYGVQHLTFGHMLEGKGCHVCGLERSGQARRDLVTLEDKKRICTDNGLEYVGCNYDNNLLNIEFYCLKHKEVGVQSMRYQNMKCGIHGCRYCEKTFGIKKSKGELETISALNDYGIKFVEQKIFKDCKDKTYLPFDFYLIDYSILIEFDGEQHYIPVQFNGMDKQDAEENFEIIQRHDKIKTQFCIDNNIPLIRIPYTQRTKVKQYLKDKLSLLDININ